MSVAIVAPPDMQDKLILVACKATVYCIMPNGYNSDLENEKYIGENFTDRDRRAGIKAVEDIGFAS